jgi:hypothetical protein
MTTNQTSWQMVGNPEVICARCDLVEATVNDQDHRLPENRCCPESLLLGAAYSLRIRLPKNKEGVVPRVVAVRGWDLSPRQMPVPTALVSVRTLTFSRFSGLYDASADGKHFLIGTLIGGSNVEPPTVIMDWEAGLKR